MNAAPVAQTQVSGMPQATRRDYGHSAPAPIRPGFAASSERKAETKTAPDVGVPGQPAPEPTGGTVLAFPTKSKRGRPKKSGEDYRVSVEQVSKHTYAVRIRWIRPDGVKDGVVVNRLRDDIVKEIKRSKKRYEQFKTQTIANWNSGAVRESHHA